LYIYNLFTAANDRQYSTAAFNSANTSYYTITLYIASRIIQDTNIQCFLASNRSKLLWIKTRFLQFQLIAAQQSAVCHFQKFNGAIPHLKTIYRVLIFNRAREWSNTLNNEFKARE